MRGRDVIEVTGQQTCLASATCTVNRHPLSREVDPSSAVQLG